MSTRQLKEFLFGVVVGGVLFSLAIFVLKNNERPALAQTVDQGSKCVAGVTTIDSNHQILWIILPAEEKILVYDLDRDARFIAARNYSFDKLLDDYYSRDGSLKNLRNWSPAVKDVKKWIEEKPKRENEKP